MRLMTFHYNFDKLRSYDIFHDWELYAMSALSPGFLKIPSSPAGRGGGRALIECGTL